MKKIFYTASIILLTLFINANFSITVKEGVLSSLGQLIMRNDKPAMVIGAILIVLLAGYIFSRRTAKSII